MENKTKAQKKRNKKRQNKAVAETIFALQTLAEESKDPHDPQVIFDDQEVTNMELGQSAEGNAINLAEDAVLNRVADIEDLVKDTGDNEDDVEELKAPYNDEEQQSVSDLPKA